PSPPKLTGAHEPSVAPSNSEPVATSPDCSTRGDENDAPASTARLQRSVANAGAAGIMTPAPVAPTSHASIARRDGRGRRLFSNVVMAVVRKRAAFIPSAYRR